MEALGVRVRDLLLPQHLGYRTQNVFVKVNNPKTRLVGARRQYVKIDDLSVAAFISAVASSLGKDDLLFSGSPGSFRYRWDAIMQKLKISAEDLTPAGARTGGATLYFEETDENLQKTCWRGRWLNIKMLEIYVQEMLPNFLLAQLDPLVLANIQKLADFLPEISLFALELVKDGVPAVAWPQCWRARCLGLRTFKAVVPLPGREDEGEIEDSVAPVTESTDSPGEISPTSSSRWAQCARGVHVFSGTRPGSVSSKACWSPPVRGMSFLQ